MKNIFENAKFGKAYKTRNGRKALYIEDRIVYEPLSKTTVLYARCILDTGVFIEVVKEPGVSNGVHMLLDNLDIISEWQE